MTELFSTLLALDAGVFGLVIAAILVHLELVTSHYSYRAPYLLIKSNGWFILTVSVTACASLMSIIALVRLALSTTDLLPGVNFIDSVQLVSSPQYVLLVSIMSVAEFALVGKMLYHYLDYLPVIGVAKAIAQRVTWQEVKHDLLSRHGILDPLNAYWRHTNAPDSDEAELQCIRKKLQRRLKKRTPHDPFALMLDVAGAALLRHDREGWRVVIDEMQRLNTRLIEELLVDPDNILIGQEIPGYLAEEFVSQLNILMEVCAQGGHPSLTLEVIRLAESLACKSATPKPLVPIVTQVLNFLEREASEAIIPGREALLVRIIEAISAVAIMGIRIYEQEAAIQAICSLGQVSGIYIKTKPDTSRSQIASRQFPGEQVAIGLIEAFFQIARHLTEADLPSGTHSYTSVIAKVAEEFVNATTGDKNYGRETSSLVSALGTVADYAASHEKANELHYACYFFSKLYRIANKQRDLLDTCQTIATQLSKCGRLAVAKNRKVSASEVDITSLPEERRTLVGIVVHAMRDITIGHLTKAMHECYDECMPPNEPGNVMKQFIRPMIRQSQNNFGLPFDPTTGKPLAG